MAEQSYNNDSRKSPFDGAEVIYSYTRAQALEDGQFIDVSDQAKEAGFKIPAVVTAGVQAYLVPPEGMESYQDYKGRLWDVLWLLRLKIAQGNEDKDLIEYNVSFLMSPRRSELVRLWGHVGPGDQGEAVLTIMLPEEW